MGVWTLLLRMCAVYVRYVCASVRASSVRLCEGTPRFSFLFFVAMLFALAAVRIMSSVLYRRTRSLALYF